MKNYIVFLTLIFLNSNQSSGQNPINKMYKGEDEGSHTETYINGNKRCSYTIKDGNLNGPRITYYKNGELWCVEQFNNGCFNGINFLLNENNDTVYIENYVNDTLLFTKNFKYYKNHHIKQIRTVSYLKDSTLTENSFSARPAIGGTIISLAETEESISNSGKSEEYYVSGSLKSVCEIKNGGLTGMYLEYYETGELKIEATLLDEKFNGLYIEYSLNGEIIESYTLRNGKKVSE